MGEGETAQDKQAEDTADQETAGTAEQILPRCPVDRWPGAGSGEEGQAAGGGLSSRRPAAQDGQEALARKAVCARCPPPKPSTYTSG